ncbi:hypothetical protein N7474_001506 [Penicillium riverlandense]|uniref:uncharacterized protein n=1 Tax=Penicillium riverlandense TaxID=1903569 RepID=UPI0025490577|nr:uncharacterized protein N7474_001506 [Penicillium riverlandense]KAJ5833195.1 hypothetical protein N7474_001506 [Penicillium riverlandense]
MEPAKEETARAPATIASSQSRYTPIPATAQQKAALSNEAPIQPAVVFPVLFEIYLALIRKLESGFCQDTPLPYREVIGLFDSPEELASRLVDAVDPTIRHLQGQTITRALLDEVREAQIRNNLSWTADEGYLDYVIDVRFDNYWRSYVGQSNDTHQRVSYHIRQIKNGAYNTLHYFVIKRGEGSRVPNFIKLWRLVLPRSVDPAVREVCSNVLEMGMTRAFQSLPPKELENAFGAPLEGEDGFSFVGLNLISPLLQGSFISSWERHQYSLQLKGSLDPDIREFPNVRTEYHKKLKTADNGGILRRYTKEMCQNALWAAADTQPGLRVHIEIFQRQVFEDNGTSQGPEQAKDGEFKWLQDALDELSAADSKHVECLLPVGNRISRLGIVLNEGVWGNPGRDASPDASIPSALAQCGFNASNILLWTATFRRPLSVGPGMQIFPDSRPISTLQQLNMSLISRSFVDVVLVCDAEAEKILFENNPWVIPFMIQLDSSHKWRSWIEHRRQRRLYISCPSPLVALWSDHWHKAARVSAIFRFAAVFAGIRGIKSSACATSLIVLEVIRLYAREKQGGEKVTMQNLDPRLRAWLEVSGFSQQDVELLETSAESLSTALLMILLLRAGTKRTTPDGAINQACARPRLLSSNQKRRRVMDRTQLEKVREVLQHVTQRQQTAAGQAVEPTGTCSADYQSVNIDIQHEGDQFEGLEITTDEDGVVLNASIPFETGSNQKSATSISSHELSLRMKLLQGTHGPKIHKHTSNMHRAYVTPWFPLLLSFADHDTSCKEVRIKAEIVNKKHSCMWASDARDDDPAKRLAFRVTCTGENGSMWTVYPSCTGDLAAKRANSFVDWMDGLPIEEISTRARRLISFSNTMHLPTLYTDEAGNLMKSGIKRKQDEVIC